MSVERTFAIIKPDAFAAGHTGKIIDAILENGFRIVAMKAMQLTRSQAEGFYHVHKERPFFGDLCTFMTEGPIVAMSLEKEGDITAWRHLMGATNPENAEDGTMRKQFGSNIERNATHGSDAPETADYETRYFFNAMEIV
jgi:nucleoside-diphosphate kinase